MTKLAGVWIVTWEQQEGPSGRRGIHGVFEAEADAALCANRCNLASARPCVFRAEWWEVMPGAGNIKPHIDMLTAGA